MTKISDVYTLWLKANHLPSQGAIVTIQNAQARMFSGFGGKDEKGIVLSFTKATRALRLTERLAGELANVFDDIELNQLRGQRIRLVPEKARNGTQIIRIYEASQPTEQPENKADINPVELFQTEETAAKTGAFETQ